MIVKEVIGAKAGPDINLIHAKGNIGFEIKNKGGFEGGCIKLEYMDGKMAIKDDCIHKHIIGNTILYGDIIFHIMKTRKH